MLGATTTRRLTTSGVLALMVGVSSLASSDALAQQPAPPPPGFEPQPGQPPSSTGSPTSGSPTQRPTAPAPGPPVYGAPPGYGPPPAPPPYYGPETLEYDEDRPIPPGYHVESSVRKGLVIGGAVTLGTVWLINIVVAIPLSAYDDDFTPLYVPVAGPFVTMATEGSRGAGTTVLAIDGIVQTGGLLMLVLGLALQKEELVRDDYYQEAVRIRPMMLGRESVGLGVEGTLQ